MTKGHHYRLIKAGEAGSQEQQDEQQHHRQRKVVEILRRNTRWTKSVSLKTNSQKGMASLLSSNCQRLEDLTCFAGTSVEDKNEWVLSPILDLVANNPLLQTFTLQTEIDIPWSTLQRLPQVLSQGLRLTSLQLDFTWRPCRGWLRYLLQNLPLTLQHLEIDWKRLGKYLDEEPFSTRDSWPETYPYLVAASFTFELTEGKEQAVHEFLERCHFIESFRYPTVAGRQITTLVPVLQTNALSMLASLYLGRLNRMTETQWCELVVATAGRIKTFDMDAGFPSTATSIGTMLVTHWGATIESLRIPCLLYSDIQLILSGCAKLKKFDCTWTMDRTDIMDDAPVEPWICTDMQIMQLVFSDGRRHRVEEPSRSQMETRAVQRIEHAYGQLGRLVHLKELRIGWKTERAFWKYPHLDMSLQSGLGRLSGLKALETLDMSNIRLLNFGIPEARWMVHEWPLLKVIRGLKDRYNVADECIERSGYLDLLSERRGLTVQ